MKTELIKAILIDESGRLCVFPENEKFNFIYRSAMEVHWDQESLFLYSPKPREWSYFDWYRQILAAVKSEYGYDLSITKETSFTNIPEFLKKAILEL